MTKSEHFEVDEYVLNLVFHRLENPDGSVCYWRSCALKEDMLQGEQGYMVLWVGEDGRTEHLHTYKYPPNVWG